jgi:hypothetical protein
MLAPVSPLPDPLRFAQWVRRGIADRSPLLRFDTTDDGRCCVFVSVPPGAVAFPLPEHLHDVQLRLDADGVSIESISAREGHWTFSPPRPRAFAHESVVEPVLAMIPPRRVPWVRKGFWSLLPALLGSRLGRAVIARAYGNGPTAEPAHEQPGPSRSKEPPA